MANYRPPGRKQPEEDEEEQPARRSIFGKKKPMPQEEVLDRAKWGRMHKGMPYPGYPSSDYELADPELEQQREQEEQPYQPRTTQAYERQPPRPQPLQRARPPEQANPQLIIEVCGECGVMVLNMDAHEQWHETWFRRS